MNDETKKQLEPIIQSMLLNALVGYRSLMMLTAILEDKIGKREALHGFADSVCRHPGIYIVKDKDRAEVIEIIEAILKKHAEQIRYAGIDAAFVLDKVSMYSYDVDDVCRLSHYLRSMEEQCKCLPWKVDCFELPSQLGDDLVVTDIGCSHFGFAELFVLANKNRIHIYEAIDKREISHAKRMEFSKRCPNVTLESRDDVNVEEDPNFIDFTENTVFLGNLLHCLQNPEQFLHQALSNEKIPAVYIIEPTAYSAHAYGFDFHMKVHGGHNWLGPDFFAGIFSARQDIHYHAMYPNKFFTLYRFVKKVLP